MRTLHSDCGHGLELGAYLFSVLCICGIDGFAEVLRSCESPRALQERLKIPGVAHGLESLHLNLPTRTVLSGSGWGSGMK